jgi:AcrR family transcriptional regulator
LYHHFVDMPEFISAFAQRWQEWTTRRAQEYAAIDDPLLRIERMQNDLPEVFFGPDQAIRVWGRNAPVLAVVLENMQRLAEEVMSRSMGELFGDRELGAVWAHLAYCIAVGLQLRPEPIDPERYLMACTEICRRLGVGVELVHVDGRLRTKLTYATGFHADDRGRRPDLTGAATPANRESARAGGSARRPGPRDRDAFFAAAWELLAERGFDGLTLLAMCDRLSVTRGSFGHHFGGMPRFVAALAADWEQNRTSAWTDTGRKVTPRFGWRGYSSSSSADRIRPVAPGGPGDTSNPSSARRSNGWTAASRVCSPTRWPSFGATRPPST